MEHLFLHVSFCNQPVEFKDQELFLYYKTLVSIIWCLQLILLDLANIRDLESERSLTKMVKNEHKINK